MTQRWGSFKRWSGEGGQVGGGSERLRREAGLLTAVSHQHSVNCSQPVAASQGHGGRVCLRAVQGPKIPSIRRSSQFVGPYLCRTPPLLPTAVSALHVLALCANLWPKARFSTTIWERLRLFLIVFHLFTAASAAFCSYPLPAWGSALLAPYPHPPFDL